MRKPRRLNYTYLRRLVDRLEQLGFSVDDLPTEILESTWDIIRHHLTGVLKLNYCIRCKLPIPTEWKDPSYTDMCIEHAASHRHIFEARFRIRRRPVLETIIQHSRQHERMLALQSIEATSDIPTEDPTSEQSVMDILNKARSPK